MKHRAKKLRLSRQFVKSIKRALTEANAGKEKPYKMPQSKRYTLMELIAQCDANASNHKEAKAWESMPPIGREFGSPDFARLLSKMPNVGQDSDFEPDK